ncbi:MAG: hypothetical protein KGH88_09455, partial [Thaumarchaeota archaeon]|nr:hypothetical protein [Nitrososphaerota archaeon]
RAVNIAMKKISGKKGNVYNIATGKSVSVNGLARLMLSISGKRLGIVHKNPKKGDIRHSQASIRLARKELGYAPKTLLRAGLDSLMSETGPGSNI